MKLHSVLESTAAAIASRSAKSRAAYLARLSRMRDAGTGRGKIGCANLAHGVAACPADDKAALVAGDAPNVAIVTAYNDMLSAHQPFETYPQAIKKAVRAAGGVAQVAGGVPAMCDGVTQGRKGMEMSLFSRDTIAMSTAIALSHDIFDAVLCLGVCDKIVPGLVMGALSYGHLPAIFVPAGPMTSGLGNSEKSKIRQLHAEGKVDRAALLAAESAAYHGPGTCTFYGTANSNQLLMEAMGLHIAGAAFANPDTPLRAAFTDAAARRAVELARAKAKGTGEMLDERAWVNAIVALLATGGSTNHTIHLIAMARMAGIELNWDDFDALSRVVPLLARIYPNGNADVNHFAAAGGTAFLMRELIDGGLLFADVTTAMGEGLGAYAREPWLDNGSLAWREPPRDSADRNVLRVIGEPFDAQGGIRILAGNLGRAVTKISAVAAERQRIEAPAKVFADQAELLAAFAAGQFTCGLVAGVRFAAPRRPSGAAVHALLPPRDGCTGDGRTPRSGAGVQWSA
ncbi:MAG: phosphogluconate dehydratase, partial [Alphaproteobacteria bacterium]|nr:phosphogluconate dehydratase [Alphaproteobacteria bacterium]